MGGEDPYWICELLRVEVYGEETDQWRNEEGFGNIASKSEECVSADYYDIGHCVEGRGKILIWVRVVKTKTQSRVVVGMSQWYLMHQWWMMNGMIDSSYYISIICKICICWWTGTSHNRLQYCKICPFLIHLLHIHIRRFICYQKFEHLLVIQRSLHLFICIRQTWEKKYPLKGSNLWPSDELFWRSTAELSGSVIGLDSHSPFSL